MVTRLAGARKRTRNKMKKDARNKGKIGVTRYFQDFKEGEKAFLKAEPAYQKGIYPLRFHGKVGIVGKKKGNCYEVQIKDGKDKTLIVHPVHLKRT